jgi:hypothetical protein
MSKTEKQVLHIAHKQKEQREFQKKYGEFKNSYLDKNTLKSMVFENGSALALLYKEMQKLVQEVNQLKNQKNYELNEK